MFEDVTYPVALLYGLLSFFFTMCAAAHSVLFLLYHWVVFGGVDIIAQSSHTP